MLAVEIAPGRYRIELNHETWEFWLDAKGVNAEQVDTSKRPKVFHASEFLSFHDVIAKSVHQLTML